MGFSLKLDDVDDNDGGTVMTTSTMKNNDVYNVQRTTSPLTSIQWQKHINLVFRIVKPKQRYHTETDCFFFILQNFSVVHCELLLLLVVSTQ